MRHHTRRQVPRVHSIGDTDLSHNDKTNALIRAFVMHAYRFGCMGAEDAGIIMLDLARRAIQSPRESAPVEHYILDLKRAGWAAYGFEWKMADLSKTKQRQALHYWDWFREVTGEQLETCIEIAIGVLNQDDAPWSMRKEFIQNSLENHPVRRSLAEYDNDDMDEDA